jgi:ribosomal protein S18 acetylase RimI-like enzyme
MKQSVTRRLVQSYDEAFLFDLYASTRAQELEALPWNDDQRRSFLKMQFFAQNQDYHRRFPEGVHELMLWDGVPAGRLYVARSEKEIRILDISLMPEYRNQGIGSWIMQELLNEASETKRPVRIYVEHDNPYRGIFDRYGFTNVEDIGSHLLLEWRGRW